MTLEVTRISSLRDTVQAWRAAGETVALVPTMGALHAGHMALVAAAKAQAKRVIVSIFVNPTQFGPNEDFHRYPRPLSRDLELLRDAGVDAAWLPTVEEMYPEGFTTRIEVGAISAGLDGQFRPGHFAGVATVVAKLLLQVQPDVALFGEKDYQQLCVIKQMARDLDLPVKILGVPTVREADGLALSSRNQYLNSTTRQIAVRINQVLRHSAYVLREERRPVAETLEKAVTFLRDAGFSGVDYVAYCDGVTLAPLTEYQPGGRLLLAATLGSTRLIDNMEVE